MNNRDQRGLSLVEVLIYLAIFSILVVALININTRVSLARLKNQSLENLQNQGRYTMSRLTTDIHSTNTINRDTTAERLHLDMNSDTIDDDIYYFLQDQQLYRQIGESPGEPLTTLPLIVSVLDFTLLSLTDEPQGIKLDFSLIDSRAASRTEFNNSLDLNTTLVIRQ